MHEMGLADAMMKTVSRIIESEGDVVVRSITVELGDLSGVVPRFLAECWEAVTDGTPFAATELILHSVPATARCLDCGETFVIRVDDLRCPACRSDKLKPMSGQDMTIAEIEVFDREDPPEDR